MKPASLLAIASLVAALLFAAPSVQAGATAACGALSELSGDLQVAWLSPVNKTVRSSTWLEVVRVSDLRAWVRAQGADQLRLLQGLGFANAKGRGRKVGGEWKVTIFDVGQGQVCRPVEGVAPGAPLSGAPACLEAGANGPRKGYTGCGYARDGANGGRGLDVYRIRWRDASRAGFCVMPLERFLQGA